MEENDAARQSKRKHIRQPPSVPFLWEERPGVAKKDWKPEMVSVSPSTPPVVTPAALKLIATVPFCWEEKPGKPLSCFSQSQLPEESVRSSPVVELITFPSPLTGGHEYNCSHRYGSADYADTKQELMFDHGPSIFQTDDSFTSVHSLLANCLVSSVAISAAVPVQERSSTNDVADPSDDISSPASETESSTSSYATGVSSLVGAEFLECLFPLYPPKSGFLGNINNPNNLSINLPEPNSINSYHKNSSSSMVRRPTTLGELIMMSRRRSYQRKAAQMTNRNLSIEFMNKKAFDCGILGTSMSMIEALLRKRHKPSLKLLKLRPSY